MIVEGDDILWILLSSYSEKSLPFSNCQNNRFHFFPELAKMLMSYKNRVAIYDQLFNEGVLVALEDTPDFKHTDNIPNLQVKRTSA